MSTQRSYIAIDLKSFYASVECVERGLNPLNTNLVVADPSKTDKTICLAVSPSLKAYGLSGRSRLFEVRQALLKEKKRTGKEVPFLIAPPRMAHYMNYSCRIYSIYLKYISAEDIHVYSIDECFMDVTGYLSLYPQPDPLNPGKTRPATPHELAMIMIRDVLSQTGITATAGIGSNLYLAKIAMDIVAKHVPPDQDGVCIAELDEQSYRRMLWNHTPLTDFWRIGKGTERTLNHHRIYTMGDIARTSVDNEDLLYDLFGIDAEILIDHAWGYEPCRISDIKEYRSETSSICSGQVLSTPYPADKARIVLREMTDQMSLELSAHNMITDSITLHIGYDRMSVDDGSYKGEVRIDPYGRAVPKPSHGTVHFDSPSSLGSLLIPPVLQLFDRIIQPDLFVRRINVTANRIVPDHGFYQMDLFTDTAKLEQEKNLQQAILDIKKKFGKNAVLKGTSLEEGATMRERNGQIGGHRA